MSYPNNRMTASFVPAVCDNCGGNLDVNPNMEKAFCPWCGKPYIVSKAVKKYNNTYNIQKNYITNNFHTEQNFVYHERKGIFQSIFEYKQRKAEIEFLREQERRKREQTGCLIASLFIFALIALLFI